MRFRFEPGRTRGRQQRHRQGDQERQYGSREDHVMIGNNPNPAATGQVTFLRAVGLAGRPQHLTLALFESSPGRGTLARRDGLTRRSILALVGTAVVPTGSSWA